MVTLAELVKILPDARLTHGSTELKIAGIAYDSRKVKPQELFVCIPGFQFDGHDFAPEAVKAGAVALVSQREIPELKVPQIIVPNTRDALGWLSAKYWNYPSRRLRIIGVTGTNGKTTTTYLIKTILEQAGYKTGLIGTIKNLIGSEEIKAGRTTPESWDLQVLFAKMLDSGVTHVVMEVSSHAVTLRRIVGTEFDIGVFTNITQDHLDFHQNFENYLEAKSQFLHGVGVESVKGGPKGIVLNKDDAAFSKIAAQSKVKLVSYGLSPQADLCAQNLVLTPKGIQFSLDLDQTQLKFNLKLLGKFNVYNSLAAIGVGLLEGLDLSTIKRALESTDGVRGRAELVDEGQDFAVVIDYAHTPDGLENILRTAQGFTKGKLIVVFGCGGDRDRSKRPKMGKIAGELGDYVIVTSDNPRSEDPERICLDIMTGLQTVRTSNYEVILDRRTAIRQALQRATTGDVVVIAGKGHEDYQVFKDRIIHFDDREEAAKILRDLR